MRRLPAVEASIGTIVEEGMLLSYVFLFFIANSGSKSLHIIYLIDIYHTYFDCNSDTFHFSLSSDSDASIFDYCQDL